ncbi:MAG: pentapeptide repeat-containing protein, partial [Pseudomonadota bacterium]
MIDGNFKKITWKEAGFYLNRTGVLADCKIITALNLDDIFNGREISKRYTFDNVVFSSQIDLSDSIFQKRLNFINCVFCGPVDLSDSIFRGNIQFIDCIFKRRIAAAGAEFTGDVEFKNCFILTDVDDDFVWPNRPFYFARARINGDLRLTDFTIRGELCLSGIKVDGKTVFSGISIENHRRPNNEASEEDSVSHLVNSRAAHTDAGNKYASEKDLVDPSQDVGWLNLRNSTLSGGLAIKASGQDGFDRRLSKISDRLNLSYATVGGPVHFQELEVFGSVLLTATKLRGLTVFDLCQISKDLDLSVHTPARIRLRGITVAERLMIVSSKIEGGLRIEEAP